MPTISDTSGATPRYLPPEAAPDAGDDAGDVGAVPDVVAGVGQGVGEVDRLADPAGEVGVVGLDAGVEHRHRHPAPVRPAAQAAGAPICGRALVEQGNGPRVQPDLGHAAGERAGAGSAGGGGIRDPGPERARVALVLDDGLALDAAQPARRPDAAARQRGRGPPAVGEDERQGGLDVVGEPLADQLAHIEQLRVELSGGQQRERVAGDDRHLLAQSPLLVRATNPIRSRPAPGSTATTGSPVGGLGEMHPIAGDQGDDPLRGSGAGVGQGVGRDRSAAREQPVQLRAVRAGSQQRGDGKNRGRGKRAHSVHGSPPGEGSTGRRQEENVERCQTAPTLASLSHAASVPVKTGSSGKTRKTRSFSLLLGGAEGGQGCVPAPPR